jgi:hypothetical protein
MRIRIRDLGIFLALNPGSGMEKIRIRDKHPGSEALTKKKILRFNSMSCVHFLVHILIRPF